MDNQVSIKTATHLYSATKAIMDILCDRSDTRTITTEDVCGILSASAGNLSVASVVSNGPDRATRFATGLQESLFPSIPEQATFTGVILVMYSAGTMTTEEYLAISNQLLGNLPDDIPTVISISQEENASDCLKGTLLVSWVTPHG